MKKIEIKNQIKENCYKSISKKYKQKLQEAVVLEESWDSTLKNIGDVSQIAAAGALLVPGYGRLISRIASGIAMAAHGTRWATPDTYNPGRVDSKPEAGYQAILSGLPFGSRILSNIAGRGVRRVASAISKNHPRYRVGARKVANWLSRDQIGTLVDGRQVGKKNPSPLDTVANVTTVGAIPAAVELGDINPMGPSRERKMVRPGGISLEDLRAIDTKRQPSTETGAAQITNALIVPAIATGVGGKVFSMLAGKRFR